MAGPERTTGCARLFRRAQADPARRGLLDRRPAEQQRHVLLARPGFEQVAVMRALGIAGLARRVDGPGIVPIADIDHHPPGHAADDAEIIRAIAVVVDGVAAAALGPGTDIEARIIEHAGERVLEEAVMQLAPLPFLRIAAEALLDRAERAAGAVQND